MTGATTTAAADDDATIELCFCESCAYSAGVLLARIAELEAVGPRRLQSGVRKRVDRDDPVTQREPFVTRKLAASCK